MSSSATATRRTNRNSGSKRSTPSSSSTREKADSGRNRHSALHRGPRTDRVEPAFYVGKTVQVRLVPLVARDPGIGGDVGDRVLAGEIFLLAQAPVEHAVEPVLLLRVALDRVGDGLFRGGQEEWPLADNRPDGPDLDNKPLRGPAF